MPRKRTTSTQANRARSKSTLPKGLKNADLVDYYSRMVQARSLDERIWALNRQGKVPIAASSQGHEATQLGSLLAAEKDGDCFLFPYYRDLALKVAAGLTPVQTMMSFMGKAGDPYSNARQFPLQGADLSNKIIQISNVVAAGLTQSVGYALGARMAGEKTVVFSYFGDGATSQGELHEAMNFASIHKLPVIFICENNRYAISTPQRSQMMVEEIASRAASYGFPGFTVDGMDLIQCYEATREAITHARSQGPVLLEMLVERFMSHTTDDDDRRYRPEGEVEKARERDPVVSLANLLINESILTQKEIDSIDSNALKATDEATDLADASSQPPESVLHDSVYGP
ncbi:MAG: thiamine pyrophosphate-dependent dehydrogenase E1 component subunit alpha [Chloroflexota bacterium]|jgi:2-oxoisovalerate dehydrogenase E1 component alpha subunit|nr:MAG: thiamine pyrophosphate-dependent dehydrogenase E1 component subunit alpha [SAR202 cluster bacterium]MCH2671760.1 thiamine pyrophosphate-dependent dehydrogenase E1 component subunit alpha [Dehalococcoidia bacterium]MEE3015028.1 thiamine pyrophosphate-dependent dehydrogenase E1 component subunit alpha [Chloroflexota bacterium]